MTKDRTCGDRREPSAEALSRLVLLLSLLGDEARLRIVQALARDGELCVSALVKRAGKSRSAVTYYLTQMRLAGLLGYRPEGTEHFYRLEWNTLRDALGQFFTEVGDCGHELRIGNCSLGYWVGSRRRTKTG